MGIKDEGKDKEDLKNLVEDSVEKKLKEFSKETEKNRDKDKKEILKELKTREEKGLNTLAQKFELLKLKAEQSNKQQSKNPLVELSDKNLKWLSEHAIANQKPEDMGKGLAKNVISSLTRKEDKPEEKGISAPLGALPVLPEEEPASKAILKSKMTLEEKVDEIHKFVTKGIVKEQRNTSAVLSKGIKGLTSSMKLIGDTVGQIFDKGKQIASLVTMGALGLIYLVGWWKQGGPDKLMKGIVNGVVPAINRMGKDLVKNIIAAIKNQDFNKEGVTTADLQAEQSLNNISNPNINPQSEINSLDKMYNLSKDNKTSLGNISEGVYGDKNGNFTNKTINEAIKSGKLDVGTGELLKNDISHVIKDKSINYTNSKGAARLSFPVAVEIIDIKASGTQGKGSSITIKKAEKTAGFREPEARIVVTNILKLLVPEHKKVPKNTTIAIMGADGQIIGDLDAFMRGAEFDEYMDAHSVDSTVADNNLMEFRNEKSTQKALQKSYDDNVKSANINKERQELKNNPLKYTEKVKDTLAGERQQETPRAELTQVSENRQKLKEQSDKLQEVQTKPIETPQQPQTPTTSNPQPEQNRTTVVTPPRPDNMIVPNNLSGNLLEDSLPISQGIR